jgi:hypothetical protein
LRKRRVDYDLNRFKEAAVVYFDEAEIFIIARSTYPAAHRYRLADVSVGLLKQLVNVRVHSYRPFQNVLNNINKKKEFVTEKLIGILYLQNAHETEWKING